MPLRSGTALNTAWWQLARLHPARMRLALRVALSTWIVTFLAIAPLCYIACRAVHRETGRAAAARLQMARDAKRAEILAWYERQIVSLSQLVSGSDARSVFFELQAWAKSQGVKPGDSFPVKAPGYQALWKHGAALRNFVNMGRYRDLFFIDATSGQVIYTTQNDIDNGVNLTKELYSKSELAKCWRYCREATEARVKDHAYVSDYCLYPPGYNAVNLFVAMPLWHERPPKAVIALQLNPGEIDSILCNGRGYGASGEAYITGKDLRVRNMPRLQMLPWKKAGKPNLKAPARPITLALDYDWEHGGQARPRGITRSISLYGKPALTAYSRLFPDYDMLVDSPNYEYDSFWSRPDQLQMPQLVLVVEQPLSEVYAPARTLTALIITIALLLLAIDWRINLAIGNWAEQRANSQHNTE